MPRIPSVPAVARRALVLTMVCAAIATPLAPTALAATARTSSNLPEAGLTAQSVNTATGEAFVRLPPFLDLRGPLPVDFALYYASLLSSDGQIAGHVGTNWLMPYDCAFHATTDSAVFVGPWGRVARFARNGAVWTHVAPSMWACRLTQTSMGFEVAEPEERRVYAFAGSSGPLVEIRDAHGTSLTLSYSTAGALTQVSDGLGRVLTFSYDTGGHIADVSDGTRHVGLQYAGDRLSAIIDAAGGMTSFTYDPATTDARLTAMTRPRGNTPWTLTYGSDGRIASVADAYAHVTTYAYVANATTVTDPAGFSRVYTHDTSGALLSVKDETGAMTTYSYDASGRRIAITDRLGHTLHATYDATAGDIASVTFADGATIALTYVNLPTAAGTTFTYLQDLTYPNGATAHATYDGAGNKTVWVGEGGGVWSWTYDGHGRATSATTPLGGTKYAAYNTDETLAGLFDATGIGRGYTYDALRRCTGGTWPTGTSIVSVYDERSLLRTFTDENGATTTYDYDANGLVTTVTTPLSHMRQYAYDAADRLISVTDPLGHVSTLQYDARGLVSARTDAGGHTYNYQYDAHGWLVGVSDPASASWSLARNAEGWVTHASDPLGGVRSWTYDTRGRAVTATSPTGAMSTRTYDAMSNLLRVTDPAGGTLARGMDLRGCTAGDTLGDGSVEQFARNAIGEVVALTDRNGQVWTRAFDASGRLETASDPLGHVWSNAYDVRGRIGVATMPVGSETFTWDEAVNQPTSIAFDGGLTLHYGYDADRRLVSADGWSGSYDAANRLTTCNGLGATRDANGRLTTLTVAPGQQITYGYDARGLLTSVQDWLGGLTTFAYDAAGSLTQIVRPNDESTSLARDAAGAETRRVDVGAPGDTLVDTALLRDGMGRVVHATRRGTLDPPRQDTTRVHTVDAASQITDAGWAYDAAGRVTHDAMRSYVWDRAGRMLSCTESGATTEWTYDALGRPLTAVSGATSDVFTWNDATDRPTLAARTRNGAVRYFVWTPDGRLLYSIDGASGARLYYHFDERGNTLALTNDAHTVVARYGYTPAGMMSESGASSGNPFTFEGEMGTMAMLGVQLYSRGGRPYDALTGRFLNRADVSLEAAVAASRATPRSYGGLVLDELLAGPPSVPGMLASMRTTTLRDRPVVLEPNPYVAPGQNFLADRGVAPIDAWPVPQTPAGSYFEGAVTLAIYAEHLPGQPSSLVISGVTLPPNAPPAGPDLRVGMANADPNTLNPYPEPQYDLSGGSDGGGTSIPRSNGDEPGTLNHPPPMRVITTPVPLPSSKVLVE